MEDSGKAAKEDKERSSVLEKQSEKKGNQDDSSSSEEDENKEGASKNDTIIIRVIENRKERSKQFCCSRRDVKASGEDQWSRTPRSSAARIKSWYQLLVFYSFNPGF